MRVTRAYVNYILFDDHFQYVSGGFSTVGSNGTLKDYASDGALHGISVPKNGYAYVYCSNESPVDVFFDNFQVAHSRGPLLEENHYYPFGLTMAGISSKAAGKLENKYKYNKGSELQHQEFSDGSGLEWYDTHFRNLDVQLGRWNQIDPKCEVAINPSVEEDDNIEDESKVGGIEHMSPYVSMGNNPIRHNDPDGDIFGIDNLIGAAVGALIDYGTQVVTNFADGKSFKESFTQVDGSSIVKSAVIGLVTSGVANLAGKVMAKAGTTIATKLEPAVAKLVQSNVVSRVAKIGKEIIKDSGVKLSKVEKTLDKVKIGDKFTKIIETKPGIGPGQSKAVYERVKNAEGTVIRNTKTSFDRANKIQNIKPKELPNK